MWIFLTFHFKKKKERDIGRPTGLFLEKKCINRLLGRTLAKQKN